jgi:secondary thiamine-phosphate synthase enzyme
MESFEIRTRLRREMVDITGRVRSLVEASRITQGLCSLFVPHTTCGLIVNENADPSVASDILTGLASLAPESGPWRHAEGNSDAHIQAVITGHSLLFPIEHGTVLLGAWQGIFLCEFDGPRKREVWVKILEGVKGG